MIALSVCSAASGQKYGSPDLYPRITVNVLVVLFTAEIHIISLSINNVVPATKISSSGHGSLYTSVVCDPFIAPSKCAWRGELSVKIYPLFGQFGFAEGYPSESRGHPLICVTAVGFCLEYIFGSAGDSQL